MVESFKILLTTVSSSGGLCNIASTQFLFCQLRSDFLVMKHQILIKMCSVEKVILLFYNFDGDKDERDRKSIRRLLLIFTLQKDYSIFFLGSIPIKITYIHYRTTIMRVIAKKFELNAIQKQQISAQFSQQPSHVSHFFELVKQ